MAGYKYTAKNDDGQTVKGILIADDIQGFFAAAKEKKLHLISYGPDTKSKLNMDLGAKKKLPLKDVTMFCRQISSLLKVGVSLVKAIDIMYQQTTNKQLKVCIKELYEGVQKGGQLSACLKAQEGKWPDIMLSMIESGEASGTMDVTVEKLADQFESDLKIRNKVKSAMTYPIILVSLAFAVVILMSTVVLPQFASMFDSSTTLPLPTRILMGFSDLLLGKWYIIVAVAVIAIILFKTWLKTPGGRLKFDSALFKLPIVKGVVNKLVVVRFTRTFSTLFSSGMSMLQTLSIVKRVVSNRLVENEIDMVCDDIRRGLSLTQAIRRVSVFPQLVHSMISIGEEAGSLDTMLSNAAGYYDEELNVSIEKTIAMVEPIMIVFIAAMVGFIIISIMLPMLQVYNSI